MIFNAVKGSAFPLNMDLLMSPLTKTPFTIFLTNLNIKGQENDTFGEGRDATWFVFLFEEIFCRGLQKFFNNSM